MSSFSRRTFLSSSVAAAAAGTALAAKKIPVGLELYSVRDVLMKDLMGTVRGVAKMGYQGVEFYSPYYSWKTDYAKEVRKLLDDTGMKCFSTHNGNKSFTDEGVGLAIELNQILGSKYIVLASAGRVNGLDGWKGIADLLNNGASKMKAAGIQAGYHNHQVEFKPIDGTRPIEVIAKNTGKDVMLQLDLGTCVEVGSDPIAWINLNAGRIRSLHLKEWSKTEGYKALLGEGEVPWKKVFQAAEKKGGVEYYLIEQEGSRFTSMETAEKCLASFKKAHA